MFVRKLYIILVFKEFCSFRTEITDMWTKKIKLKYLVHKAGDGS